MDRRKFFVLTGSAILPFSGCTSITGSDTKDDEENVQDTPQTTQSPTETPQSIELRDAYQFTYDSTNAFYGVHPREDVEDIDVEATVTGEGWFDKQTQEFFIDTEFTRFDYSLPMSYYHDGSTLYRRGWNRGEEKIEGWLHQEKFRENLPGGGNIDRSTYGPHQPIPTDFTTEVLPESVRFLYARTDAELQELAQSEKSVLHEPTAGASTFYYNREVLAWTQDEIELSYSFNNNNLQRATAELPDAIKYIELEDGYDMTLERFKETFTYSQLNEKHAPSI